MNSTDQTATAATLTEAQRDELITQIRLRAGDLYKGTSPSSGKPFQSLICDLILPCPDQTVIAVHEYFMFEASDDPHEYREQCRERREFIAAVIGPRYRDNGYTLHDYLTFKDSIAQGLGSHYALDIIRLLPKYKQLPTMESYSDATEETKAKIAALLKVTSHLFVMYKGYEREHLSSAAFSQRQGNDTLVPAPMEYGLPLEYDWTGVRLHGDDFIDFILARPEDADAIIDLISKDGITDPTLIMEIFTSKTPALRGGLI